MEPEIYTPHEGTLILSRTTPCKRAAQCALHYFSQGLRPIEFFYIGANAGQQAMKAMGIFRYQMERMSPELTVVFRPHRVRTFVKNEEQYKDAAVWRAYVIESQYMEKYEIYESRRPTASGIH